MRKFLKGKIHNATVTEVNLEYEGSITIDRDILDEAKMLPFEHVEVYNVNNGERFTTYILEGERGSRVVCLNGAAARKASVGDKLIIASFVLLKEEEIKDHRCCILIMDDGNKIKEKKVERILPQD